MFATVVLLPVPLEGSPKFQVKLGALLVPTGCKACVKFLQVSPFIFISVICAADFWLTEKNSTKTAKYILRTIFFIRQLCGSSVSGVFSYHRPASIEWQPSKATALANNNKVAA